jgi:hypothetical protein
VPSKINKIRALETHNAFFKIRTTPARHFLGTNGGGTRSFGFPHKPWHVLPDESQITSNHRARDMVLSGLAPT